MKLIDADVLKQHIDKLPALPDGNFAGNHSALKALINMQPTIQLEKAQPSQEGTTKGATSDLISRQAAIDALISLFGFNAEEEYGSALIETLNGLPTIQPQSTTGQLNDGAQSTAQSTDLIDRQAVIKVLDCWQEAFKENSHHASASDLSLVVKDVKSLPTIQPKPQWIPVSERLPRDGTWNIFTDGKNISVERYKADAIDHFFPNGRWFQLEDVIAWMPLPEAYKPNK